MGLVQVGPPLGQLQSSTCQPDQWQPPNMCVPLCVVRKTPEEGDWKSVQHKGRLESPVTAMKVARELSAFGKPLCFNVLYEEREDDFPGLQSESMPRKPERMPRITTRKSQQDKTQERRIHNVGDTASVHEVSPHLVALLVSAIK